MTDSRRTSTLVTGATAVALLLFGLVATPARATTVTSGCLAFEVSDTDVTVTDGTTCTGAVTIPATVSSKPVIAINAYAFRYAALTSVSIPASVISIGQRAFSDCASMWKATFASGSALEVIPDYLFAGAPLTTVTLPNSVVSIGTSAFSGVKVKGLSLPSHLQTIQGHAFSGASELGFVVLPSGLSSIGDGAFQGTNLDAIAIPDTVTSIGLEAFKDVATLVDVTFPETGLGTMNIGDGAFQGTSIASLTLTPVVSYIGISAFADIAELTSVTFPDTGYIAIGSSSFTGTSVTSVTLTSAVTLVGPSSFAGLTTLTSLTLPASGSFAIGESAFASTGLSGTLVMTPAVTGVGLSAFQGTTSLTSVTFPATGSMAIGEQAFFGSGLTSLTLGAAVTAIGDYAFQNTSVTSVTVPSSVGSIGAAAFKDVVTLRSVTFAPAGLTAIGDFAFYGTGVGPVDLPTTLSTLGLGSFGNSGNLTSFTLAGASSSFAVAEGVLFTADGTELVAYPSGRVGSYTVPVVTAIRPWAFAGAAHLSQVTFAPGGTVSSIPGDAFTSSSLTGITLPATITLVDDNAFRSTSSLGAIRFLGDAPTFGDDVFTATALGSVYYVPTRAGWTTAFEGPLAGFTPVRMVAPIYGTGSELDEAARVSGRARVNKTLTVRAGTWSSDVSTSVRYLWYSCKKRVSGVGTGLARSAKCSVIAGQKRASLTVSKKYRGTYIVVSIRLTNEFGSTTRFTPSTAKVS